MPQVYYSTISINASQVPSTQTDFPVLVSQTDNRFKTVGNGGHVANANGYDIRPYTDITLATAITGYELERYNASTGEVIMWVKVSSLSSSTTPIVLGYGDTSIVTDGSSTTTWSNSFLGVYHLGDGSTLNVNSATGSNNGTNHGATATSGKIDGAGSFASASSQYIDCGTGMTRIAMSYSAWVNGTTFPTNPTVICGYENATNTKFFYMAVKTTGKLDMESDQRAYNGTGANTLSTGTTYFIAATYSAANGLNGYFNGALDKATGSGGVDLTTTAVELDIGEVPNVGAQYWNGWIDEVRIAGVERSADWIATEYNNQNAPGTFETLGAEQPVIPISGLYRL